MVIQSGTVCLLTAYCNIKALALIQTKSGGKNVSSPIHINVGSLSSLQQRSTQRVKKKNTVSLQ